MGRGWRRRRARSNIRKATEATTSGRLREYYRKTISAQSRRSTSRSTVPQALQSKAVTHTFSMTMAKTGGWHGYRQLTKWLRDSCILPRFRIRTLRAGSGPPLLGIGGVKMNTTRRDFLKSGAGAVAATSAVSANSKELASSSASGERTAAPAAKVGEMIYRKFGSTDATFPRSEWVVIISAMCPPWMRRCKSFTRR